MKPFEKCPICGGEVTEKEVKKMLIGGKNTAAVRISAEVCLHCGERLYSEETIKLFEKVRDKLKNNEITDFQPLGQFFMIKNDWVKKEKCYAGI
jgi:YgiT-type zinc finger domain-containing protein